LEEELKKTFGDRIETALIAGSGGVFEIELDGRQIFSKKQSGRFPDPGEVERLVREALD